MSPISFDIKRWQIIAAFLIMVGSYIIMGVLLETNITQLQHDKASIVQLEGSNCRIRTFLLSSAHLRARLAAKDTTHKQRQADIRAEHVALELAKSFANERCPA